MTNLYQAQLIEDRLGLLVAARLSDAADELPYEITERLRAARVQALSHRKIVAAHTASSLATSNGVSTISFGNEHLNWWDRIAALLPLLALILGLIAINVIQNDTRASELAEIDAALLTDDLPPAAYTDAGFTHFLKLNSAEIQ